MSEVRGRFSVAKDTAMAKRRRPIDLLGGPSVPVYRMADQEFCELKVDLELRHPKIQRELRVLPEVAEQLEKMERGKEFHETIATPAEPISAADVQQLVQSRRPFTLIESSLLGRFGNLPLIGRPDALHFDGVGNAWVIEHKVRDRPYMTPSDEAQLRLYGFLLMKDKRFEVDRLSLVCVVTNRDAAEKIMGLPAKRRIGLAEMVCKEPPRPSEGHQRWDKHCFRGLGTTQVRAAVFHYDPKKVVSELRFLSGYWLGKRQPVPTKKPQKCSACRVNALRLCPVARVEYGESSSNAG